MIKFGTDGWRAKIADEFTFENLKIVAKATANYLLKSTDKKIVAIGYDNRFLSEFFAFEAAKVIEASGFKVFLTKHSCPTPALSLATKQMNAACGIMITASHNPAEWNGYKVKTSDGCSAPIDVTSKIEDEVSKLLKNSKTTLDQNSNINLFDIKIEYFKWVSKLVNIDVISKAKLTVVFDPMFGSSIGYLDNILSSGKIEVETINGERNPLFGGINPEPLQKNAEKTIAYIKDQKINKCAGIVLDGDGDRIAAIDENGNFINSHYVFAILLKHLVENRKMSGIVVKTFNITKLIDKLCKKYGLELLEKPIGFKNIAELMLNSDILIGGEESGGFGIKGHIPERDGTLNGLLLLECMAMTGKTLGEIIEELNKEFGQYFYDRYDSIIENPNDKILNLKRSPPTYFAGKKITAIEDMDGIKFVFEDAAWILFRASGTEPLLRIYCEAKSKQTINDLLSYGNSLIK